VELNRHWMVWNDIGVIPESSAPAPVPALPSWAPKKR
jgi:hypothetical protein